MSRSVTEQQWANRIAKAIQSNCLPGNGKYTVAIPQRIAPPPPDESMGAVVGPHEEIK